MIQEEITKYEKARIIGARALQLSMGAPILLKLKKGELEEMNFNPINIAKKELLAGVLPLKIKKRMPKERN